MKRISYTIIALLLTVTMACNFPGSKNPTTSGTTDKTESGIEARAQQLIDKAKGAVTGDSAKEETTVEAEGIEIPAPLKKTKELIIKHTAYTVSYNSDTKIPNWVAWKLTPERFVPVCKREKDFNPDPQLPEDEAVTTDDYKNSGWDRGHMCPANDNRWRLKAMRESFYMTNICPQNSNLNRGDWKELEDACHTWAEEKGALYIVCGPILYRKKHEVIGYHNVVVPEAFFKVILCMGKHPKAIGFIYKNNKGNNPLDAYTNSVDQVERITGIDFFPSLPDNIENSVEKQRDLNEWQIPEE